MAFSSASIVTMNSYSRALSPLVALSTLFGPGERLYSKLHSWLGGFIFVSLLGGMTLTRWRSDDHWHVDTVFTLHRSLDCFGRWISRLHILSLLQTSSEETVWQIHGERLLGVWWTHSVARDKEKIMVEKSCLEKLHLSIRLRNLSVDCLYHFPYGIWRGLFCRFLDRESYWIVRTWRKDLVRSVWFLLGNGYVHNWVCQLTLSFWLAGWLSEMLFALCVCLVTVHFWCTGPRRNKT